MSMTDFQPIVSWLRKHWFLLSFVVGAIVWGTTQYVYAQDTRNRTLSNERRLARIDFIVTRLAQKAGVDIPPPPQD